MPAGWHIIDGNMVGWGDVMKTKSMVRVIVSLFALVSLGAHAGALPLQKNGGCPSGYYSSGNYCVPSSSSSSAAIAKTGSCPSGYYSSGNYCVGN